MTRSKTKVALICGGTSSEREVSLRGAEEVYLAINKNKYDVVVYDPIRDMPKLASDATDIGFAFVVMHGNCGEDGAIQGFLDLVGIPYQGSGILGSAVAMDKVVSKRLFMQAELPIVPFVVINSSKLHYLDWVSYVDINLKFPVIVKPSSAGSSKGVSFVDNKDLFLNVVIDLLEVSENVLVETYIKGIELTCGVLGNSVLEALPLVEIIPDNEHKYFDYKSKYSEGLAREICPARINSNLTKQAQSYAKIAHTSLFCKGYSRTDMILKNGDFYLLETNSIPGMTRRSLYPKAASYAGISFEDLVEKLILLGLEG